MKSRVIDTHDPAAVVSLLRSPATYPHGTEDFEVVETHISRVFLVGPFVYKLKKPVRFAFLDYSTRALRRHFCEEELRLNRRLAPEIYLDVVSVVDDHGTLRLSLDGSTTADEVEPIVRMRRLDEASSLHALVLARSATCEHIDRVVARLASFYAEQSPVKESPRDRSIRALRSAIEDNATDMERFVGSLISRDDLDLVIDAQKTFLTLHEEHLLRRVVDGRVRDGHGDLRCEHVAFVPDCVVIDCIEFDEGLRAIDTALDIAFLRMDLTALGAAELAEHLVDRYVESLDDEDARPLLDFFASYRAFVRAKIDGLKLLDPTLERTETERLVARAKSLFKLSKRYTESFRRPRLILIGGVSGSGKSTLSRRVRRKLGAFVLHSDEIRKELAGLPRRAPAPAPLQEGLYSPERTRQTYEEIAERARRELRRSRTVIADASFLRRDHRELLHQVARELHADFATLECQVPRQVARARVGSRRLHENDASDATEAVVDHQFSTRDAFEGEHSFALETSRDADDVESQALSILRQAFSR